MRLRVCGCLGSGGVGVAVVVVGSSVVVSNFDVFYDRGLSCGVVWEILLVKHFGL